MKSAKNPTYLLVNKHFAVLAVLVVGLVIGISIAGQRTQVKQQAAQEVNLNTSEEIVSTNNTDGTMGPLTASENFSNSLPAAYRGQLELSIKDSRSSGDFRALKLRLNKIETHLVYLFLPGETSENNSVTNSMKKTNQNVNKWETLGLNGKSAPLDIEIRPGETSYLGQTILAGGKYTEVRLYISKATVVNADGREVELNMPGQNNIIRIVNAFSVFSAETTSAAIDLDISSSISQQGDSYFLLPFVSGVSIEG